MATELAKAYVQIIPSANGIKDNLSKILGNDSDAAGKSAGSRWASAFGKAASVAGAGVAAGTAAAATAVVALAKSAVDSYAEYEQLAGGAELMFGEAYNEVAQRAAEAYKNVQMSQNEYLRQVNGFATGLKTALGGNEQAAAELADRIVTAEADIVAATGNSQENIQNAFNGIMKSNYTMLDNLQLGITPTKAGFEELIAKVNEWNAANGRATGYVIGNLADCQSALVDYVEMQGLAGYAQNEAAQTIQGSLAATKSAWNNLLTGLVAQDADLQGLIGNLVESAKTAAANLIPAFTQSVSGIGTMIQELAPVLANELPALLETLLPSLLTAGASLLTGLVNGIIQALPTLLDTAVTVIGQLGAFLIDNLPLLADTALRIVSELGVYILNGLPLLTKATIQIIAQIASELAASLPEMISAVTSVLMQICQTILDNLPLLLNAAHQLITGLAQGFIEAIPELLDMLPEIINSIVGFLLGSIPQIIDAGAQLLSSLVDALPEVITTVVVCK